MATNERRVFWMSINFNNKLKQLGNNIFLFMTSFSKPWYNIFLFMTSFSKPWYNILFFMTSFSKPWYILYFLWPHFQNLGTISYFNDFIFRTMLGCFGKERWWLENYVYTFCNMLFRLTFSMFLFSMLTFKLTQTEQILI